MNYQLKKVLCVLVIIGLCTLISGTATPAGSDAKSIHLKSKITEVTVFLNQAQVTRSGVRTLAPGQYRFVIEPLPDDIEEENIRVNGSKNMVLQDIQYKTVEQETVDKLRVTHLETQKETLDQQLAELNDKTDEAKKEKKFIDKIVERITKSDNKSGNSDLNPDHWIKMVNFYRTKTESLNKELRETRRQSEKLSKKLEKTKKELSKSKEKKDLNRLEVLARVSKEGNARLTLTYIVNGPYWDPVYDMHVSSTQRIVNLYYNARVQQDTGEDWTNVKLKLSTADPDTSESHPVLSQWKLSLIQPQPPQKGVEGGVVGDVERKTNASSNMYQMTAVNYADSKETTTFNIDGADVATTVDDQGMAAAFVLPGTHTIKSDDEIHRVPVMNQTFKGHFRYSTIPDLSESAFLKVKISNNTKFHILQGTANIYLDNGFVSTSSLKYAAPGASFWTFLGEDKAISVTHTLVNKTRREKGKKTIITVENLITVESHKKTAEELVIWDKLPISQDKAIKVTLLEPQQSPILVKGGPGLKSKSELTDGMLMQNESNYLEWFYKMTPGRMIKIPFKYKVEYPKERKIKGI